MTPRSSVEQQLLVRSLKRAIVRVDLGQFKNHTAFLQAYSLTADREFALELVKARFREVVDDPRSADLHLQVFLDALGVDRAEQLVGIPKSVVPVISVPTPEIAVYKSVRNHGYAEIQVFAFDRNENRFVGKSQRAVGEAKYDDYTPLLFISFNLDDLNEKTAHDA